MRIRFTIRDLLWLTLVVALGVALWLEHRQREFVEVHFNATQLAPPIKTNAGGTVRNVDRLKNCKICHADK